MVSTRVHFLGGLFWNRSGWNDQNNPSFSHTGGSYVSWNVQPDLYYDKQNFNNNIIIEHNATTWDRLSLIDQESVENHTAIKPNSKTEKTG